MRHRDLSEFTFSRQRQDRGGRRRADRFFFSIFALKMVGMVGKRLDITIFEPKVTGICFWGLRGDPAGPAPRLRRGPRQPPHTSLTSAVLPRPRVGGEYPAHRTRLSRGKGGEPDRLRGTPSTRGSRLRRPTAPEPGSTD